MSRSSATFGSRGPSHLLHSLIWRLWSRRTAATFGLPLLVAVSGCAEAERSFGDTVNSSSDSSDSGAGVTIDATNSGADASTSEGMNGASNATETRNVTYETGETSQATGDVTSDDSGHATGSPDGGSGCVPAVCAESTECRTYRAVNCDSNGDVDCEVTNVDAETPCDSGNGTCDGQGECIVPNLAVLGATCDTDDECGSRHCAMGESGDKVCCDTACEGVCTTCSAEGHCDATPTEDAACGELTCDESSACVSYPTDLAVATCAAFGECETVESYCEPDFTSVDVECGDGLVCDGNGACVIDCPDPSVERVCTTECPCETGQGVCTNNDQCADGFVCTSDAVAKLGFPASSCLPAHCVNNEQDAEETSVDCGGGCGCRATYEILTVSGVPEGARMGGVQAMSGDGSAFAATIVREDGRISPPYPARMDASGVVTELDGLGASGTAFAINADGSVIVGDLWCSDPPDCTSNSIRAFRWTNDAAPVAVFRTGSATAVSATGTIVAGIQSDVDLGDIAFRASSQHLNVPQLDSVVGMSADGEYIAGRSSAADVGALWSMTLQGLVTLTPPSAWLTWGIHVLSDDGKTFAGAARVDNTNVTVAYIWNDGTFSSFPKLPGADSNQFEAISADGTVLVGMSGAGSVRRAFIWDASKGIRTVLSETADRGLELPVDLEIGAVDFLSDDGNILVGRISGSSPASYWRITLSP